ncbi:MAG TPA: hypothetical protein VKT24_05405 [Rhizomicrobium sp.]|nr:hypothetical protein [Rhizomicrobium sp.]
MKFRSLIMASAIVLGAGTAFAADAPPAMPMLIRGTIVNIDAKSVTITKADGTTVTGALVPTTNFSAVEPRRLDQIKPTDFVGITSVPAPNGDLMAEEIHIIPLKGLGEGSYPWDHHPEGAKPNAMGSMTNATVATVHSASTMAGSMTNATVTSAASNQLQVTYHGSALVNGKCVGLAAMAKEKPCTGIAMVDVMPSTAIVAIVPAKNTDARAGLAVFANMMKDKDGNPVVGGLVMEKNGVKPEF